MSVRIVVEPSTVRAGGIGPTTGNIWIELGPLGFPVKHWNDFVVVILEAWVGAMTRLSLQAGGQGERVHFMDGPYSVEVVSLRPGTLGFRAIERSGEEKGCEDTQAAPFIGSLISASERTLAVCRDRNCWSTDADKLVAGVVALKGLAEQLVN
jgi:hypothetical protein